MRFIYNVNKGFEEINKYAEIIFNYHSDPLSEKNIFFLFFLNQWLLKGLPVNNNCYDFPTLHRKQYQHPLASAHECFEKNIHLKLSFIDKVCSCIQIQYNWLFHLSAKVSLQTLHHTVPHLQNNQMYEQTNNSQMRSRIPLKRSQLLFAGAKVLFKSVQRHKWAF